jgi:hypothetical protein
MSGREGICERAVESRFGGHTLPVTAIRVHGDFRLVHQHWAAELQLLTYIM